MAKLGASRAGNVGAAADSCASPEAFAAWTEELLGLEKDAEDEETSELLATCTHAELQARGIAILKLAAGEQTTALYGRTCLTLERPGGAALPAHRITQGDILGVFDQSLRPLSKAVPLASAVVQKVRPAAISLVFDGDVPVEVLDGRQLNVATISSEVTLRRYRDALNMLTSNRQDGPSAGLMSMCFGDAGRPRFHEAKAEGCERPDAVDCAFRTEQSHRLNEPQQAAVVKALRAKDMAIIHGPPGTGKTTTLVAYILEAAYRKQRLLVTAPSNVAVDNLLERVVDAGCRSVVRIGHPARVQSELQAYTLDNVVYSSDQGALCRDIKREIDDALKRINNRGAKAKDAAFVPKGELGVLRKELRQRERRAVTEVLKTKQVVFATCPGAATLHREARRSGAEDGGGADSGFDVVIIDEAAQALEVSCWIPMLLGRKTVLAGDHQQLAACVKSNEAQRRGLDRTLFARMIDKFGDDVAALLSIQYRMNATIMGWSSRSFYDQRLEAADSVASRTLELSEVPAESLVGETLAAMQAPMLFVDTGGLALYREDGFEEAGETARRSSGAANAAVHQSRFNRGEARFLAHYAKMLVKSGLRPADLTVITPYSRQVELLRAEFAEDAECQKLGLEKPRVNTVDSFQGQEADAVLISLVRSNERGVVGFLSDYRRLNVAVTRARKHVMLVGDASTICSDDTLGSLYDYACEAGRVCFVQQLLDEDGHVPADPAAVAEPRRDPKAQKKAEEGREKRQAKLKDEEEVRRRFEAQLSRVVTDKGMLELPASLNSFERAMAHEVAAALGLLHESSGEGLHRRLRVWSSGYVPRDGEGPREVAVASATAVEGDDSDSDSDRETALQAFERRAAALMDMLPHRAAPAQWRAPADEEVEILQRLARERGFALEVVGSGRRRRCHVSAPQAAGPAAGAASATGPAPAAEARAASSTGAAGYPPSSSSAPAAAAAAGAAPPAGANAGLAQLHAERKRREEERKASEAAERRQQIEAARLEIQQAKRVGKQKQAALPKADSDDFDALLEEFTAKDDTCSFGNCKAKIHTLMDSMAKCGYCHKRFCMTHVQAEVHGCGDAAQRAEQKKFRQAAEAQLGGRGTCLASRPGGDNRGAVANKLQDKLQKQQEGRAAKKKEGKK